MTASASEPLALILYRMAENSTVTNKSYNYMYDLRIRRVSKLHCGPV